MIHRSRLLCALAALLPLLAAPPGHGAEEPPRIVFAETAHDFGEVEEGVELQQRFRFRNAGGGILEARGG